MTDVALDAINIEGNPTNTTSRIVSSKIPVFQNPNSNAPHIKSAEYVTRMSAGIRILGLSAHLTTSANDLITLNN